MKLVVALLVSVLCISCDRTESSKRNDKAFPRAEAQASGSEEAKSQGQDLLQKEVESFFTDFSIALTMDKADAATVMIEQEYRERFRSGYRLWRGTRFLDPIIKKVSEGETIIEVEVDIKHEQRGDDRETKRLRLSDGKWQLLDS